MLIEGHDVLQTSGNDMKRFLLATLVICVFALNPHWAFAQSASNKAQIAQTIETFRTTIINKDKDRFMSLFLKDDITWTGVTTDASIERLYASRPNPEWGRPEKLFNSSPRKFIDFVAGKRATFEETFSNVHIDGDDDVAQVSFDYSFMVGNYKQNWGKESWQLVRTTVGWKIASVIWSQELNPTPPPKDIEQ